MLSGSGRPANKSIIAVFLAASLIGLACPPGVVMAAPSSQIASAAAAARRGDIGPIASLRLAPEEAGAMAGYLSDDNEDLRREAMLALARLGGREGCGRLVMSLTDPSADVRERTARAVQSCLVDGVDMAGVARALINSLRLGPTAHTLLLARRYPEQSRQVLASFIHADAPLVKLESWMPPIPVSLPAAVAGASAEVKGAAERIDRGLANAAESEFLTRVLNEIELRQILLRLLALLDDTRETASATPSGVSERRRICDLALDAFVERLRLSAAIPRHKALRYSTAELRAVRTSAEAALAPGGAAPSRRQ